MKRCKENGVTASIAWCLTPENSLYIQEMYSLCREWDVFLRINIYKPVHEKRGFTYDEFWKSMDEVLYGGNIISVSEGILNAAINNKNGFTGCNPSNIRIFPDGTMSSCVYIPNNDLTIESCCEMKEVDLLSYFCKQYEIADNTCKECAFLNLCHGGCLARKKLAFSTIDEFCFVKKNKMPSFRRIKFSDKQSELFIHSEYICTIIIEPRKDLL